MSENDKSPYKIGLKWRFSFQEIILGKMVTYFIDEIPGENSLRILTENPRENFEIKPI